MTTAVVVLADDLIWSTRLTVQLREIGARPVAVRTAEAFAETLPTVDRAIVDLTARAYDGITEVASATVAGRPVLAIGQHDDLILRRRAIAAGAEHVYPYRRLFESGPALLARWLGLDSTANPTVADPAPADPAPADPTPPLVEGVR